MRRYLPKTPTHNGIRLSDIMLNNVLKAIAYHNIIYNFYSSTLEINLLFKLVKF